MKRWSNAFPGAMKVTYSLGYFKTEKEAYAAYEQQTLQMLTELPQDQVHPRMRSGGHGKERKFWAELHFATVELGEAHIAQYGGDPWYCVGLQGEDDSRGKNAQATIGEWIKHHTDATGADHIKSDVIENYGEHLLSDEESPSAYVYINNANAAVMLKLALGGRA